MYFVLIKQGVKLWTFLQRNSEHGCLLGCLLIVVIGIGIILLFSILGLTQ